MRILALETSAKPGSVAALMGNDVVVEYPLQPSQQTARSLAPGIDDCVNQAGWTAREIELVAVTHGPGSFTGLRLGVTTAKMLAYVSGAEVIGVNTLALIAAQAPADITEVSAVIDAHRQQVFTGTYQRNAEGLWNSIDSTRIVDDQQWLRDLAVLRGRPPDPSAKFALSGPGLQKFLGQIPEGVRIVDPSLWQPRAATVGRLAYHDYLGGRRDDVWQLVPHYYRLSAAEEKLIEKRVR